MNDTEIGLIVHEIIEDPGVGKTITVRGVAVQIALETNEPQWCWQIITQAPWRNTLGVLNQRFSTSKGEEMVTFIQTVWPVIKESCLLTYSWLKIYRMAGALLNQPSSLDSTIISTVKKIHDNAFYVQNVPVSSVALYALLPRLTSEYLKTPEGDIEAQMKAVAIKKSTKERA